MAAQQHPCLLSLPYRLCHREELKEEHLAALAEGQLCLEEQTGEHLADLAAVPQEVLQVGGQMAHPWLPSRPCRLSLPADPAAALPAAALLLLPYRPYRLCPREELKEEHLAARAEGQLCLEEQTGEHLADLAVSPEAPVTRVGRCFLLHLCRQHQLPAEGRAEGRVLKVV